MARVLLAGTFAPDFARNRRLSALLEHAGHEVVRCNIDVWGVDRHEIPDRGKARAVGRLALAYPQLVWRFMRAPKSDLVLVLYPGWFDMLLLGPLARIRRMPTVFDIFISLHDTVVTDRRLRSPGSALGRFCGIIDRLSLRAAQRVLADTPSHAEFFAQLGGIEPGEIGVVWLGAQDDLFGPRPDVRVEPRRVLFHGTFIGLQGLETIIRSAKLLEDDDVLFRIIGTGQEQTSVDALLEDLAPTNVVLTGLLPVNQMSEEIAAATICLGIFGTSGKAARVVPNKVFECVAVGRPVITGDTPAIRSAFSEGEIAVAAPGDEHALAAAIQRLLRDPAQREEIAKAGRKRYLADYATHPLSQRLTSELLTVLAETRS